ncbi:hypothetical protein [Amycolatopsis balhimycina]|uniref:hypothetical protein n=1 Tax=Amycolatopsis balhimycina TaxID=208443 RepID=UPI000F78A171|nr:hypothetical protein [Amycolatopsis balhimycina]
MGGGLLFARAGKAEPRRGHRLNLRVIAPLAAFTAPSAFWSAPRCPPPAQQSPPGAAQVFVLATEALMVLFAFVSGDPRRQRRTSLLRRQSGGVRPRAGAGHRRQAHGITGIHLWTFDVTGSAVRVRTEESWDGDRVRADTPFMQAALDQSLAAWPNHLKKAAENAS